MELQKITKILLLGLTFMLLGISNRVDAQTTTNLENLAEILPANAADLQLINAFATRPSDIGRTHFYTRMSISRNGNIIAVEYKDIAAARLSNSTVLQLWDLSTVSLVQTFDMNENIDDFRLSPNGDYLSIAGIGSTISLWDTELDAEVLAEEEGDHIRFSDSGQYFAYITNDVISTSSSEEYIVVFDLSLREEVVRIPASSPVFDLRFSPDSTRIATVGLDGLVRVWNILSATNEPDHLIGEEGTFTFQVYFSNDSRALSYILLDGTLHAVDLSNEAEIYQTSCDAILRLTSSKENGSVFATCPDGVLRLLNVQTSEISPPLQIEYYWDLNYSETILLSSDEDNSLELVDIENGEILKTLDFSEQIISARFSPNGELLVVIGNTGKVSLFGVM